MMSSRTLAFTLCALALGCSGGGGGSGGAAPAASQTTTPATTPTPPPATTPPAPTPAPTTPPAPAGPSATGLVKVLTYNVAGLPMIISKVTPLVDTPLISPKLNAYELVLVQEDFSYHHLLEQDANHPYQSVPLTQVNTFVADGLNRFSNSPFTPVERQVWSTFHGVFNDGADGLSSKGFSFARHTIAPGVEVDVYNLHADAGRDAGDKAARQAQFAQLTQYIQTHSAGRPLIVAGDTNLRASDADDEQVLQTFLTANNLRVSARVLNQTPDLIDRIMLRSSTQVTLEPLDRRIATEMVDANGDPLSDHEAVHVDVLWQLWP